MIAYLPIGLLLALSTFPPNTTSCPAVSVAAAFVLSPQQQGPPHPTRTKAVTRNHIRYVPPPPSVFSLRKKRHLSAKRTIGIDETETEGSVFDADMLLTGDGFVENLSRQQRELKKLNEKDAYMHHFFSPSEAGTDTQNASTHSKTQQQHLSLVKAAVAAGVLSLSACIAALKLSHFDEFINAVDLAGTAVFAFGGAVTAGNKGMDLLGITMVATITAIGGGTTRDLLLGISNPAFWMRIPAFLKTCVASAVLTFVLWPPLERKFGWKDSANIICLSDAFGLAAFAVVGTQKAIDLGLTPVMWVVSALISCTFGGIIRDVLCQQKPRVMYPERTLYATPPVLGSIAFTTLIHNFSVKRQIAAAVCFVITYVARVASFNNPIRLPHWNINRNEDMKQK